MGLFDLPAMDKGVFFQDYPLVRLLKKGTSEAIEVRALPSFIGMVQTSEGIEIGEDSHEIGFNMDDLLLVDGIEEDDKIIYPEKPDIVYSINRIARDRKLGIYSCYLRIDKLESHAGTIEDRED